MKKNLCTAIICGLLIVSGCASSGGTVKPVPTPTPIVDDVKAVRDQAAVLAAAVKAVAKPVSEAHSAAQARYDAKAITAAVMQAVNSAGIAATTKGLEFLTVVETVETHQVLRSSAGGVLDAFDKLARALEDAGVSGAAIRMTLAPFDAYVR